VFAALVLVNRLASGPNIDGLATAILYARIAQSTMHVSGESPNIVNVRFGFFIAQWSMMAYIAYLTLPSVL